MAGKGTAALILGGAAAFMLMPKKKKRKKGKVTIPKEGIAAEGSVQRTSAPSAESQNPNAYQWRVAIKEAGVVYAAQIGRPLMKEPEKGVRTWNDVGEADNVEDAQEMAIAAIEQMPGYEPDLEIVDSGRKGAWEWRVYTDPERGFVGQYRLAGAQWLAAIEGAEYSEGFKLRLWELAEKAHIAAGG